MDVNQLRLASESARAQARADALLRLYGVQTPPPQVAEDLDRYRFRLLAMAQTFLPEGNPWRDANIGRQPSSALDSIEAAILDEGVREFRAPCGPLRSVVEFDASNRPVRRFYGDPREVWQTLPCHQMPRRVASWSQGGRGSDSPKGRALAAARAAVLREAGL
jgi:hypothetical protein